MTLPVAILAGGMATRLRPATETVPKSLLNVAGKPFIERQLAWLRDEEVQSVVVCTGFLGAQIEEAIGDGERFGLDVRYSYDGASPLGTGGALKHALSLLGDRFMVLYGDSFLTCSLNAVADAFHRSGKPALMTVFRNDGHWDLSNAALRPGNEVFYDKRYPTADMDHIDYGLGVLSASTLDQYPDDAAFDLADVYRELSLRKELAGHEVMERFYEIGSFDGLRDAEAYFTKWESTAR